MKNILVVGGAGYIGSHVVCCLLDQQYKITVFDNLSTGSINNIFEGVKFIEGDILDYSALLGALEDEKYDGVIHLAGLKAAGESMDKPEKYAHHNISGTINLLNAISFSGTRNIVFSSSAAVYGSPQYLPLDEEHPAQPENFYGLTKLHIEELLHWYDKLKEVRYVSLRYFNAAGFDLNQRVTEVERVANNLLPRIMEVAVGLREEIEIYGNDYDTEDSYCIRDYIHVNDLAKAHLLSLEHLWKTDRSIKINLGSEKGFSVNHILRKAREITGKPIPARVVDRRKGDPAVVIASSNLAGEILGWEAVHSDADTLINSMWQIYKRIQ
ncbi:UDP-glucose 4-epimerase GalE [Chloroflexota bacterium]